MLRLMEVASQSETFVKLTLRKSKSKNVNRSELFDCHAAGDTLEVFSLDKPPLLAVGWRPASEKLLELFDVETSITSDTSHGESVDWIVARNRHDANTVRHHDMFTLAYDSKA